MSLDILAPPGTLDDDAHQAIANERSRINTEVFRTWGLRRSRRDLGSFLRGLAVHPERISSGNFHGMSMDLPIKDLVDHIRLYTKNRKPYAAIFHPYSRLCDDTLKALAVWTGEVGLSVCVDADSEYYPGVTLRIVLYRKGFKFPETDLV
jgi:hypothetical protein